MSNQTQNNTNENNSQIPQPPKPPEKSSEKNSSVEDSVAMNKKKSLNKLILIIIGAVVIVALIGVGVFFVFSKNNKAKVNINEKSGLLSKITSYTKNNQNKRDDMNDFDCKQSYEKLLEANSFDFDKYCINQNVRTGNYDENAVPQKKKNLVLIFDASGSMAARINGKRKIDIAKEAAWKFIDQVADEENFALSIVVYGHKGGNAQSQKSMSCAGIDEIYYLGDVNAKIAKSKLNNFDATGWTPIAGSFQKAKEILSDKPNDENFILLLSDGKEMCDGDPVSTIKAIKNQGLNVKADVIGFDVGGVDEAQLKAIAEAGDGDYFSVSNAVDLDNAFAKHKEMLNKANFKIGRTLEQLSDVSFIINNYNQCLVMLKKEEAVMMLDIHARKLLGANCEQSAQKEYESRVNDIKQQLDQIYESDMKAFNSTK